MHRRPVPTSSALALSLALTVLGALSAACGSTRAGQVSKSAWLKPSPLLQQQLQDELDRLPWTHGIERLEQIRWFAAVGEPAYDLMLDLISDERDHVSAAALAALGATGDRRLVPHVQAAPWNEERRNSDLNLERARTLVRLGDWSEIPTLIAGLEDERLYTRGLCVQALREATHQSFGYDARAELAKREPAVQKWQDWWWRRTGEGLLGD